MDLPAVKEGLERARKLIELGGDWDRRNRLKVYEVSVGEEVSCSLVPR
jgi:hypothetical protein